MSELFVVPIPEVPRVLSKVELMLLRALKRDPKQTWERVRAALLSNEALLLLITKGSSIKTALVVEIHEFALSKVFHVWLCAGEGLDLLKRHLSKFEEIARAYGCDRISYTGRSGFLRLIKFHEVYITAFRKL